jgi:hypothetical protein
MEANVPAPAPAAIVAPAINSDGGKRTAAAPARPNPMIEP